MRAMRPSTSLLFVFSAVSVIGVSGAVRAGGKPQAGDAVFGLTKVVPFHLQLSAAEFARLQPAGGRFGFPGGMPAAPPRPAGADTHRSTFGVEYPWAKGDLTVAGTTYRTIGLRYKGNYTYLAAAQSLRKSLKLDLDRHDPEQRLDGLKKLNLHCGVADASRLREAFSYAFFRAAGVPAPRTAFAELTLTVPDRYDREMVGVYTVVEQVDRTFLARHFKNGKGLLLKPEGLQGGLPHLGDDWTAYEGRYRPRSEATAAQQRRLIEFTRLIDRGSDARFEKEIGAFLDVEAFLRFLAANALLANLDSFLGFGHNFYLYLVPGSDRFVFIPWDLDLSLAAWPVAGTPEQQVELSLTHPHSGANRLIDRLLAIPAVNARYRAVLRELAAGPFARDRLMKNLESIERAMEGALAREARATAGRRESSGRGIGPFGGGAFGQSLPPRRFVERRTASVAEQLAGKKEGFVPRPFGFGPGGFGPPASPRLGEVMPEPAQARLKLTAEQRERLATLQREVDARIEALLTPEQRAEWKKLREARPGFGRPGGVPGLPGSR